LLIFVHDKCFHHSFRRMKVTGILNIYNNYFKKIIFEISFYVLYIRKKAKRKRERKEKKVEFDLNKI